MEIDAAQARQLEERTREELSEGDDDRDAGSKLCKPREKSRIAHLLHLLEGDPQLPCRLDHRRLGEPLPRFAGRDGCETTSTGRNSLPASARSAGTANSGVPKKTVRSIIRPRGYTLPGSSQDCAPPPVARRGLQATGRRPATGSVP